MYGQGETAVMFWMSALGMALWPRSPECSEGPPIEQVWAQQKSGAGTGEPRSRQQSKRNRAPSPPLPKGRSTWQIDGPKGPEIQFAR